MGDADGGMVMPMAAGRCRWRHGDADGGMVMPMAAWWFLVRFYLCPSGEDVLLPTSAQVVRMRRCLPRSHVEWDVLFYLS